MKRSMLLKSFLMTASLFVVTSVMAMEVADGAPKRKRSRAVTEVPAVTATETTTPEVVATGVKEAEAVNKIVNEKAAAGDKKARMFQAQRDQLAKVLVATQDEWLALPASHKYVVKLAVIVATVVLAGSYGYPVPEVVSGPAMDWVGTPLQGAFTYATGLVSSSVLWAYNGLCSWLPVIQGSCTAAKVCTYSMAAPVDPSLMVPAAAVALSRVQKCRAVKAAK